MKVFDNNKNSLKTLNIKPFNSEREIQSLVEKNTEEIFNLEFIKSEVSVSSYRIDSLCYDNESNSFIIIEYKKGSSYSVIDQGYTYLQLLLNNKSDFLLILSQHLDKVLNKDDVDWSQSKILFISQSFNSYQKDSVNFKDLPFELWTIERFSNNFVALNQHNPSSNESIGSLKQNKSNSIIKEVSKEVRVYDEFYHSDKLDPKSKEAWKVFRDKLLEIDGVSTKIIRLYIKFEFRGYGLCYCGFTKNKVNIGFVRGNIKTDGSKSKNFFDIDDPKSIVKEQSWTYKNGVVGNDYKLQLDKNSDIDYLVFLVNQKIKNINNNFK